MQTPVAAKQDGIEGEPLGEPLFSSLSGQLFPSSSAPSSAGTLSSSLSLKLPDWSLDQDGSRAKSTSARVLGSGLLSPDAASFQPSGNSPLSPGFVGGMYIPSGGVWNPPVAPAGSDWPLARPNVSPPTETVGPSMSSGFATRPRSSSRSAPNTPRQFEWGSSMPYNTAPVSPHHHYYDNTNNNNNNNNNNSNNHHGNPINNTGLIPQVYAMAPQPYHQDYGFGRNGLSASASPSSAPVSNPLLGSDEDPFPATPDLVYSAPGAFSLDDEEDRLGNMPKQAEHPSRTLFVRNLPNDTDPLALQAEFEQFGPVRSIYANCKYRGFVMISFFDIRHSKAAMLVLNGKKVQGKKMDVHYALPKDNAGEKESNQGTLVVFNLDTSMTDDDIRAVFSEHGEVKDIRSTPNKNTHKFVEFFDVRDAERALLALNRTKVRSKIIKIEVSRPSNRGRAKGPGGAGGGSGPSPYVPFVVGGAGAAPSSPLLNGQGMGGGPVDSMYHMQQQQQQMQLLQMQHQQQQHQQQQQQQQHQQQPQQQQQQHYQRQQQQGFVKQQQVPPQQQIPQGFSFGWVAEPSPSGVPPGIVSQPYGGNQRLSQSAGRVTLDTNNPRHNVGMRPATSGEVSPTRVNGNLSPNQNPQPMGRSF